MSTCNRLDLQPLGSQWVMPKNLPDHCSHVVAGNYIVAIHLGWLAASKGYKATPTLGPLHIG